MVSSLPPRKTEAGQLALRTRDAAIGSLQRRLLILVDGRRDLSNMQALFPGQDIAGAMDALARAGLIEWGANAKPQPAPTPAAPALPENWAAIEAWMAEFAQAHMGMLATPLVATLNTVSDAASMRRAVSQWHMALRGSRAGREASDAGLAHVEAMLAAGRS